MGTVRGLGESGASHAGSSDPEGEFCRCERPWRPHGGFWLRQRVLFSGVRCSHACGLVEVSFAGLGVPVYLFSCPHTGMTGGLAGRLITPPHCPLPATPCFSWHRGLLVDLPVPLSLPCLGLFFTNRSPAQGPLPQPCLLSTS